MSQELIDLVERKYVKGQLPNFHIGDTVDVLLRIREGNKERTQIFNGVVIARSGRGMNETLTVRRIVNNEGVERIFMIHSPVVVDIKVRRRGKVRRAKLYYLRDRVGKARRLRELRISKHKGTPGASEEDAPSAADPVPEVGEAAAVGSSA
jgi:large subunit ribosomal protein L19